MNRLILLTIVIALTALWLNSCKTPNETKKMDDIITTPSGLSIKFLTRGNGIKAEAGDMISVHYTGKLTNDSVFDSSVKRGQPIRITLGKGQVIKGWDEGLAYLRKGDKATLTIPPDLAYGDRDLGVIPPNSTLVFDVELVDVQKVVKPVPFNVEGLDTLKTESGLRIVHVMEGNGPRPAFGRKVSVHYSGYLEDGKMFDSSIERGNPISFEVGTGRVIKGWDEGIMLLRKGGKARLIIPPHLGYGDRDTGPIPANSTLIFDVELVNVE